MSSPAVTFPVPRSNPCRGDVSPFIRRVAPSSYVKPNCARSGDIEANPGLCHEYELGANEAALVLTGSTFPQPLQVRDGIP